VKVFTDREKYANLIVLKFKARNQMKFISKLSPVEQLTLEEAYKNHPTFRCQQRAHAILLSNQGYTINQLIEVFHVRRKTVSAWLNAWINNGIVGLKDASRSGRPAHFTPEEQALFLDYLDENPHQIKVAIHRIQEETGKKVAIDTYKRILKKATLLGNVVDTH